MTWHADVSVDEIGSPQRIAPYAWAIQAEMVSRSEVIASGRLILLHDPDGNETWDGQFRFVSYATAGMDLDLVADPALPDVSWSWLQDALEHRGAHHYLLAGTVTASYGKSFGEMEGNADRGEVEIRSSWTPVVGIDRSLTSHLWAWQDQLAYIAGRPPLPDGVVAFPGIH